MHETSGRHHDTALMAGVLGVAFLVGGALGLAALALPHAEELDEVATLVLSGMAAVAGLLLLALRRRVPALGLRAMVLFALVVITLSILAFDDPRSDNELFFLVPVLFAFYFFRLPEAIACGALAIAGYAAATLAVDPELELVRAVVFSAVLIVDGAVVRVLGLRTRGLLGELRRAALTDPLTGLSNRRGFWQRAEAELAGARELGAPVALVVCDLDEFKVYNDRLGHLGGDRALERVADVMRRNQRAEDVPARLGGEEFAVVMVRSDSTQALRLAERERAAIEAEFASDPVRLTCSYGISLFPTDGEDVDALLSAADRALYAAKALGRNRALAYGAEVEAALAGTPLGAGEGGGGSRSL